MQTVGVSKSLTRSVTSDGDQIQPRLNGYRNYQNTPLQTVIEDLEAHHVIPAGTKWQSDSLKSRAVSTRWLLPTTHEALRSVAESSGVEIVYPVRGIHGLISGSIRIQSPTRNGAGAYAYRPETSSDTP
jgi:hypothetical protein